ncbi:MAG: helicase C-terminal domain-containing protein [Bacillota bacterium]
MPRSTVAIKDLVTFLFGTGNLESQTKRKSAQLRGQDLHRELQSAYEATDQSEVTVRGTITRGDYTLELQGRIDGVLKRNGKRILEEIKSTETPLKLIDKDTFPQHRMQLLFYGYFYCLEKDLDALDLRLTYIHYPDRDIKSLDETLTFNALEKHVMDGVDAYLGWLEIYENHQFEKQKSLEGLSFPHEHYREGQYHFMGAIYKTLVAHDILYATAPTGIGKTIGALFSGLKTLQDEKEKLFFLTAKNAGKTIAVKTMETLKANGLKIKAITLNSKENMCLMDEVDCDPELCPYAKGYYDRLRKGLEDIFVHDDVYDAELIMKYGEYHTICPHEFALDISNYCDVIIADYNYVFDPRIKLIRYFEEAYYKPKLLIDEAHNLIDRSRSMHSASLTLSEIKAMEHSLKGIRPSPLPRVRKIRSVMEDRLHSHELIKARIHIENRLDDALLMAVEQLVGVLGDLLETHKKHKKRKAIREAYFRVLEFLRISEYFTDAFRFTIEMEETDASFNIVCLDASGPLSETINTKSYGTVLFSATLKPVNYFSNLITRGAGKSFEVPSPFDPDRLGLMIDVSTSTRYHDRPKSVERILDTLYAMLEVKKGNYIAFFPSYQYMAMVMDAFEGGPYEVLVQKPDMSLFERRDMLETFKAPSSTSKIMFSVLGGSFSEGVDYVGDMLSGVLVVGVALPALSTMNQLLRDYYSAQGYDGFDYAYTYPGINKVIQAVGRVIRRSEDKGIAILIDSRYASPKYKALMPSHWHYETLRLEDHIQTSIRSFWEKFSDKD